MNKNKLEKIDEDKFVTYVEEDGYLCLKMNVGGRRGWPDRLIMLSKGKMFFIEFKRVGEKPRKLQYRIHDILRVMGYDVQIFDKFEEAVEYYKKFKRKNKIS